MLETRLQPAGARLPAGPPSPKQSLPLSFGHARGHRALSPNTTACRRVLLVGDAAHAFCPSLGQGASVAIEDACAAGALLREGARRGAPVTQMVDAVVTLRLPRVREIARTSRHHAIHLAAHEGQQAALDAEVADWTGAEGGTMAPGEWRRALESMWKGYPRVSDVVAHAGLRS